MGPITRTSGLTCARATYDGMEIYVVDAETFGAVGVLDPEIKEAVGK